jgi:hypothetical protein
MDHDSHPLLKGLISGLHKGWHGFIWMMKILVPISFLTALLQWSGWLGALDFLIQPLMSLLHLPAMAALPLLIGALTGIYGGIAAMMVLPLSRDQMTLIAIFLLIAHNLIQEGVIQGQSGLHPLKATFFRLIVATTTVILVSPFFETAAAIPLVQGSSVPVSPSFPQMLGSWGLSTLRLSVKIMAIIMGLMVVLETLKTLGWISTLVKLFTPFLKILGLSPKVGILWSTAVIFGLAYGAAVIVEEAKKGNLTKDELEGLHYSIGINHSMVEDPLLFVSLGLSAFWLYIPRLIMAIITVRLIRFWQRVTPQPQ